MHKEEQFFKKELGLLLATVIITVLLIWNPSPWLIALISILTTTATYVFFFSPRGLTQNINYSEIGNLLESHLPQPIAVVDDTGQLIWHNNYFVDFLGKKGNAKGFLSHYFPNLQLVKNNETVRVLKKRFTVKDRIISVSIQPFDFDNKSYRLLIFIDITNEAMEAQVSFNQGPVIALLELDNLAQAAQSIEEEYRPLLVVELDRILSEWAGRLDGYLKKNSDGRYILILNNESFREAEKTKFEILDKIREVDLGNKIPVTLSIGFGIGRESLIDLGRLASDALQLGLERGGDQAVVKSVDNIWYFGGKSKSTEKRTKVKARVNAYKLKELIMNAGNVIIMGHENADFDSIGASVGLAKAVVDFGKNTYIIIDQNNSSLNKIFLALPSLKSSYKWLKASDAMKVITQDSLLIVVDTHKPSMLIDPEVLKKTNNIVVIDHHRRGEDFIEKAQMVYIETYASSTCELVTELLQYLGDDVEIDEDPATALLAGIIIDTKSFLSQTGVRTFEAASYLRRQGAEPENVQQFLKDDLDFLVKKAQIIQNSQIIHKNIAVSYYPNPLEEAQVLAAQGADALMNTQGIIASFVICLAYEYVTISARSNSSINVQVIMERIGGGGHITTAAAQIKASLDEAKKELLSAIDDYLLEEV